MQPSKLPDGKARACLVEACRRRRHGVILGMIAYHHVQGATVREDPDTRFFTAQHARPPSIHKRRTGRQGPEQALAPPYRGSYEKGRPWPLFDHSRLPAMDRRGTGRPSHTARTYLPQEGSIDMSPHNDRCTSQAKVSPDQDRPQTAVAAFSSGRRVIHSSIESIRRVRKAHHRAHAMEIIQTTDDKNHPQTDGIKGTRRNSRPFDPAYCSQYWGRRRYGPLQLAFRMA
jgi:hypothetical protein